MQQGHAERRPVVFFSCSFFFLAVKSPFFFSVLFDQRCADHCIGILLLCLLSEGLSSLQ
jgi:hypothetical protein